MKPATPLPWKAMPTGAYSDACKDRGAIFVCNIRTGTHVAEDSNQANAAYIVHACNNYQRLVEALRSFQRAASADKVEDFSAVSNAADNAGALLRELKEAE